MHGLVLRHAFKAAELSRLLGPWDGEGSISYRSPLASGMLGLPPGERARV